MSKIITPPWVFRGQYGKTFETIEDRFAGLEFFAQHKADEGTISSPVPHLDLAVSSTFSCIRIAGVKFDTSDTLRLQYSSDGVNFNATSGDYSGDANTRAIDPGSSVSYSSWSGASMFIADNIPASGDALGIDLCLSINPGSYLDSADLQSVTSPPNDASLGGDEIVTRSFMGFSTRGPLITAVRIFPADPAHNIVAGAWCVSASGYAA